MSENKMGIVALLIVILIVGSCQAARDHHRYKLKMMKIECERGLRYGE